MKWRYLTILITMLIAVSLDLAVFLSIPYLAFTFNAIFVTAVVYAFIVDFNEALLYAALQGIVLDLFSPTVFGVYTIVSCGIVVLVILLRQTWFKQTSMLSAVLIAAISLLTAYIVMASLHAVAHWIGLITINPMAIVTLKSSMIGLVLECITIGGVTGILVLFKRFVIL